MIFTLRVFLPFALGYLLSYVMRVVNAVAGEPMSRDIGLSASDLGFLTSVYFMGFAVSQLPFGILMDRYGARRVASSVLVLASIGCVMFAVAADFGELVVGRVLMGIGASMGLMAPFTAFRHAFPADKFPLFVGFQMSFGAIGAALGGGPTEALILVVGWQALFGILAAAVLAASALIFILVPAQVDVRSNAPMKEMVAGLGEVLKSRALWRIAPLSAMSQAGYLSVVSLWTGVWLREGAGLAPIEAAVWLSVIAAGLIIGFVGYGFIGSRAHRAGKSMEVFLGGTALLFLVTLGIIFLPTELGTPLWLVYTAVGSAGILTYAIIGAYFPQGHAGRVNTTLNFVVFFCAFLVQWLFGVVLGFFVDESGAPTLFGFQVTLGIFLALQVLSALPLLLRAPPAPGEEAAAQK
ncbi:MAG: MFS transporter [Pseudomonadota bacterium]